MVIWMNMTESSAESPERVTLTWKPFTEILKHLEMQMEANNQSKSEQDDTNKLTI